MDLLRAINEIDDIPDDALLATIDVVGLYTNIRKVDAIEAVKEALEDDNDPKTEFILKLVDLIMKWNLFEFDGRTLRQLIGLAMGTRCAPNLADLLMAKMDKRILEAAKHFGDPIKFFHRFLDDIILIGTKSSKELHQFLNILNSLHPTLKFTLFHTKIAHNNGMDTGDDCDCESTDNIPFLDTSLSIINSRICSDLYRKPSDRCQYLLPQSCHPPHCTQNIPYSLALRIVRICSDEKSRDARLNELKQMLLSRNYSKNIINAAIARAVAIPRSEALKRVVREKSQDRPVFVITYDPRLPSIVKIVHKHYRTMIKKDPRMKRVFPAPPLIALHVTREVVASSMLGIPSRI